MTRKHSADQVVMNLGVAVLAAAAVLAGRADAFAPAARGHARPVLSMLAAKGKGFGKPTQHNNLKPIKEGRAPLPGDAKPADPEVTGTPEFVDLSAKPENFPEVSEGAADFLNQLREQEVAAEDRKQERLAEIMEKKATLRENPDAGIIPEVVANRMILRMAPLAGVPIFGGIALFIGFYLAAIKWDITIPPAIVAYSTTVPWVLGLFGLTYGLMSASWDPEVEGSFWGWKEAKDNVQNLFGGLQRSGEDRAFLEQYQLQKEQDAREAERIAPRNREERRMQKKQSGESDFPAGPR